MASNAEVGIKVGESLTIVVSDEATGAEMQLTLTADGMFVPVEPIPPNPEPEPPSAEGAAKWLAPLEATASSLETGHIVQLTAWGGDEYGYAYTYALVAAPPGIVIDADTGRLALSSALSVGDKKFTVRATNREDTSKSADFDFTLHVLEGVTNGVLGTGGITHATFDPHSGTWGKPSGNNWTNVFNAMQKDILALQTTCPDEKLRVDIPLKRGVTYQYTNNTWLDGIQYFQIYATGSATGKATMQCTSSDPDGRDPYGAGPLNLGGGGGGRIGPGAIGHQIDGIKAKCALIATVAAGATTVTLRNAGDAAKIKVGRWHQVVGSVTQLGGYPPNCQYCDYVKVTAVSGTTVTLDRPLKYGYDQTWFELTDPAVGGSGDSSLGMARLCPYDTGGAGGYIPSDRRIFQRIRFADINFPDNPNGKAGRDAGYTSIIGAIDCTLERCDIGMPAFSESQHFIWDGCTKRYAGEWDKIQETVLMQNGDDTGAEWGGATGVAYLLFRNHHMGSFQMSPRQLRAIDTHFDGSKLATYGAPITMAFQGPLADWDFGSAGACQFTHCTGMNGWVWNSNRQNDAAALTLGTNGTWKGNQLQIPRSYGTDGANNSFEGWLTWGKTGAIISTGANPPFSTNWGYVESATSPGDGTALWLNVVWVAGSKPTSGAIYLWRRRRLTFAEGNIFNAGTTWASPLFFKQVAPGQKDNWDYPQGYPPEFAG